MNNRNKKEIVNEGIEVKGNEINYPNNCLFSPLQNVSVDTNVKKKNLHDNDSSSMYEFFGLSETGVQTDLTNRDIEELLHSKLCRLDQQELIEFLKAEEQFYQNNSNAECSSFLNHKRKKTNSKEEITISSNEKKEDKSTLNQLINTNNNNVNGQDIKKDNSNLSVNQNGNANVNGRKPIKKKIDAFILFKEEYRQMHKNECKKEWSELPKELKKLYNINADNEYKTLKKQQKLVIQQNNSIGQNNPQLANNDTQQINQIQNSTTQTNTPSKENKESQETSNQ